MGVSHRHLASADYSSACLDIPARLLYIEENTRLIADDPCIMTRCGNSDITWSNIEFCAIVHSCAKVPGNDVAKMCPLATLRTGGGPDML
ncbi:MAG: hypothetical protein PVS3B3_25160 [Ktedonobacteraceae bacterium]